MNTPRIILRLGCLSPLTLLTAGVAGFGVFGCSRSAEPPATELPIEYALLLPPPQVPPPIIRRTPAHVVVDLEVREVVRHLAEGVDYTFWTFGGGVPGPLIRVREGDLVEIRLHNHPSSKLPHNIDLHAVNGSGGGASSSVTAPGHSSTFSFEALNPGIFVYHCATAPVPMHVGSGMYGMILVEPKRGFPQVDREYYIMQGEFYTAGRYGDAGLQPFDPEKAEDERPPYVVFNGAVGSLVGDHALQAKVGETVRIFFGDGGPNLVSSFHIIGEVFETVYLEGGTEVTQHNVQTTAVPPGGATIVELRARVPGTFLLVDHALSRAFGKGALGMLKIAGPENKSIYSGKIQDLSYLGSPAEVVAAASLRSAPGKGAVAAGSADEPIVGVLTKEMQIERGKRIFNTACFACHQPDGKGLPGVFPPLAGSDFLQGEKSQVIDVPLKGRSGPMKVNGKDFNSAMPPQPFTDQQIGDVLTYVMNAWGNRGGRVSAAEVASVRAGSK